MPYIITLKEPIKKEMSCSPSSVHIIADFLVADADTPNGLIKYGVNGKMNYIPVANLLGTFFVKDEIDFKDEIEQNANFTF